VCFFLCEKEEQNTYQCLHIYQYLLVPTKRYYRISLGGYTRNPDWGLGTWDREPFHVGPSGLQSTKTLTSDHSACSPVRTAVVPCWRAHVPPWVLSCPCLCLWSPAPSPSRLCIQSSSPVSICVSYVCCRDKILKKTNLKEKRFILAHGFRDFSAWLWWGRTWWCQEHVEEGDAHFLAAKKDRVERAGDKIHPQWPTSSTQTLPPKSPFNCE
jgi:hypothetical protein